MPVALIFSLDYEIFGDGSGNVDREQIAPTNALLDVFEQHGAKLTVFFEYGQYVGYQRFASAANSLAEDNDKITRQLVDVVERGHDVQLHYHPTWHSAPYENGRFYLNASEYDISLMAEEDIEQVLKSGKDFLEQLLRPVRSDYECSSFRAGALSMRQPERFLPIFARLGFKCDSSVVPGARFQSISGSFDYRKAHHSFRAWPIRDNLATMAAGGRCFEVPIYTLKKRLAFLEYANPRNRRNRSIVARRYPTRISETGMGLASRIMKILSRDYYMADYNSMSNRTLSRMITSAVREVGSTDEHVPVMLIGHSKMTQSVEYFHDLFRRIAELDHVEYCTLGTYVSKHLP